MKKKTSVLLMLAISLLFSQTIRAQGCLDAAVYFGSTPNSDPLSGKMFAFRGDDFSTFDWNGNSFGDTESWADAFNGLQDVNHIDAAFDGNINYWALIADNQVFRIHKITNTVVGSLSLSSFFPDLPSSFLEGIDAAYSRPLGNDQVAVVLLKGSQQIVYRWNVISASANYLSGPTLAPFSNIYPAGVDAAVYALIANKIYFKTGNEYIRVDGDSGTIDPGYPFPYNDPMNWGDFPSNWSCINAINNGTCDIGYNLPDNACGGASSYININVSNAPGNQMGSNSKIIGIALQIDHSYVGDLSISLISPSGVEVLLSSDNGGSGSNYGVDCQTPTYFFDEGSTSIIQGTAPFANAFRPEEPLASINDGTTNPNGIWQLKICDNANADVGVLEFVQINFSPIATSTQERIVSSASIKAYPSPNEGDFTVEWDAGKWHDAQLIVTDIYGRSIYQSPANPSGIQRVQLGQVASGIYFLQLHQAGQTATRKISILPNE